MTLSIKKPAHSKTLALYWSLPDPLQNLVLPYIGELFQTPDQPSLVHTSDISNSDAVLFPICWGAAMRDPEIKKLAWQTIEMARANKKKVILFWHGDAVETPPPDDCIQFRQDLSTSRPNWIVYPEPIPDPLNGEAPPPRKYQSKPTVSFQGLSRGSKNPLSFLRAGNGHVLRSYAMKRLQKSPHIQTSFQTHETFFGSNPSQKKRLELQKQYFERILNSDYVLCCRGTGNFSIRLYEVLASGRIPLYIDTGAPLPRSNEIDWNSILLRVPHWDLWRLPTYVRKHHVGLNPKTFQEQLEKGRKIWLQYFSPTPLREWFITQIQQHSQAPQR